MDAEWKFEAVPSCVRTATSSSFNKIMLLITTEHLTQSGNVYQCLYRWSMHPWFAKINTWIQIWRMKLLVLMNSRF